MAIKTVKANEVEQKGLTLKDMANNLVIRGQVEYDYAAEFLTNIKTKMKEVEAAMDPQCRSAYDAWQTALSQKKKYVAPYLEAETIVKRSIGNYQLEQRKLAEEAERIAREIAERQEEKERAALLRRAAKCKDVDKAMELEAQAEMVFVPVITPTHEVTKAAGVSTSVKVRAEITNTKDFLQWLIDSNIDADTMVTIKTAPLEQYAKLTKVKALPGCRFHEDMVVSAKGRV